MASFVTIQSVNKNILVAGVIGIFLFSAFFLTKTRLQETIPQATNAPTIASVPQDDKEVIRTFLHEPHLELSYVGTDLPMSYFRVGKVTKVGNGENMDKVEGWVRQVHVYDQKDLINGQCGIYEFHTDARNRTLTAMFIRGLRQNEVDMLKEEGATCSTQTGTMPKISKSEAEIIAFDYLRRAVPTIDQMKDQFEYSLQSQGESHQWLWEDRNFVLPEGLASRPYHYPIIRMVVNGDKTISYWNTVSLFQ